MKAQVYVTYRAVIDVGELDLDAVRHLFESDGDYNIFDASGEATIESVEVSEAKK